MTGSQYFRTRSQNFLVSYQYIALLIFLLLLNTFLVSWYFITHDEALWFIALEIFSVCLLTVEILFRWVLEGKTFFYSISNIVDFILGIGCVLLLVFYIEPVKEVTIRKDENIQFCILLIRYIVRIILLLQFMRRSRHQTDKVRASFQPVVFFEDPP